MIQYSSTCSKCKHFRRFYLKKAAMLQSIPYGICIKKAEPEVDIAIHDDVELNCEDFAQREVTHAKRNFQIAQAISAIETRLDEISLIVKSDLLESLDVKHLKELIEIMEKKKEADKGKDDNLEKVTVINVEPRKI